MTTNAASNTPGNAARVKAKVKCRIRTCRSAEEFQACCWLNHAARPHHDWESRERVKAKQCHNDHARGIQSDANAHQGTQNEIDRDGEDEPPAGQGHGFAPARQQVQKLVAIKTQPAISKAIPIAN